MKKNQFDFTFCTFNILSEDHLLTHGNLYSFCPPNIFKFPDRGFRILEEIELSGNPDILCLQEVYLDHYTNFYSPELTKRGYDCVFGLRESKLDGCALFFKKNKFSLLQSEIINYRREDLIKILDRSNIGIIAKFKPLKQEKNEIDNCLVVGTTHLLFNPKRGDIKLAQIRLLFAELERMALREVDRNGNKIYYPILIGGDFNLIPNSPLYQFIAEGNLNCKDLEILSMAGYFSNKFSSNKRYISEDQINIDSISSSTEFLSKEDDKCHQKPNQTTNLDNLTLTHNLKLKSVFKSRDNFNQKFITTKHERIYDMVDYIFYNHTKELDLIGFRKLINENNAIRNLKYMPNEMMGSDHFSLIANFSISNRRK